MKIVDIEYGKFALLNNTTDWVQKTIGAGNIWEPEGLALCEKYAFPNSTVLDIGANLGAYTVRLAQLVGPRGKVIAYEPQRVVFQQLCANVFINDLHNVYAYNKAVGADTKPVRLTSTDYINGSPGETRIIPNSTEGELVECDVIDNHRYKNLSLIKIDVERYEPFVFDGARHTIEEHRPIILFELTTLPLAEYPKNWIYDMLTLFSYNIYEFGTVGDYIAIPEEKDK